MQIQGSKRHRIRIRNTEKSFFKRFIKDIFIIEPESGSMFQIPVLMEKSSVADPDPADLNVFGPPGSGSTSQRMDPDPDPAPDPDPSIIMQK